MEEELQVEMAEEIAENEESDNKKQRFKLGSFEGPLDLLLDLVRKAKIDIHDIFVSEITEQYMAYMSDLKDMDLDKASEFIEVAALLLEIKSKALLPKENEDAAEDENDPKKDLIRRLEEYKLYKEASLKMKEMETVGIHFRPPDPSVGDVKFVLKDMNMDGLMKALQKLLLKLDKKAKSPTERKITMDRFTVSDIVSKIKDVMLLRDSVSFYDLFEEDYTKSEIITTFQALLELLKMQVVRVEQQNTFGEIILHKVA